jgi:phasin family protein
MPRGKKTQPLRKAVAAPAAQLPVPVAQEPAFDLAKADLADPPAPYLPIERADVEALARSSVALTDGVEAFGRELFDFQRQSLAAGLSAVRALIDARNLEDVVDLHGQYLRGSVERAVRQGGRLAELANKVASDTWQPLQDRAAAVARKLGKPAAA